MNADGPSHLIGRTLADIERWAIEETLRMTNDNREEAAKILNIGARTLYRRLDQYKKGPDDQNGPLDSDDQEDN
jgi:two-component system, NtrC family, response regulator HydG